MPKFWLDSTTVRGTLITAVPTIVLVLKAFGIDVTDGELGQIIDGVLAIGGAVGVGMAIWGRHKATPMGLTIKRG